MTQDHKTLVDIICGALTSGSVACSYAFESLPVILNIMSIVAAMFSIWWFVIRIKNYYKTGRVKG